jgi:hypothetical protein
VTKIWQKYGKNMAKYVHRVIRTAIGEILGSEWLAPQGGLLARLE